MSGNSGTGRQYIFIHFIHKGTCLYLHIIVLLSHLSHILDFEQPRTIVYANVFLLISSPPSMTFLIYVYGISKRFSQFTFFHTLRKPLTPPILSIFLEFHSSMNIIVSCTLQLKTYYSCSDNYLCLAPPCR